MSVRLITLFLRARLAGWAVLGLVAVCVAFFVVGALRADDEELAAGERLAVPLILALLIVGTTRSPFGDVEAIASQPLGLLRLGKLAGLGLLAVMGAVLAAGSWQGDDPRLLLVRNLGGLTGIGLLAAVLFGVSLAWVAPMLVAFIALFATPEGLSMAGSDMLWTWLSRPIDDLGALTIALVITAAGLAANARRGARIELDDGS